MLTCHRSLFLWIVTLLSLLLGPPTWAQPPAAQPQPTYVRVSPRDARYLETDDGRPYIPIGLNMIYPPFVKDGDAQARLAALDGWLTKLSSNGGNYIRVWLGNDFYNPEDHQAGEYDLERARRIDAMLALAAKHGIRVKMTIEHFRVVAPVSTKASWAMQPLHHVSRGGLASGMKDWMDSPVARRQFVGKLQFLAGRYRDEPTVYGWELWNEMNAVQGGGDYLGWTAAMLPEASHSGPSKLYAKDKRGAILHDILFAPFFAGAAGAGQCWHWDDYVDANNLWWQFSRFAAAVKDLDPPAEAFTPVMIDHPDVRVYALMGRHTLIAWCRDKASDWKSELADGTPPRRLTGVAVDFGSAAQGFSSATSRIYDPWANRWTEAKLDGAVVKLPDFERSIVVRIEK